MKKKRANKKVNTISELRNRKGLRTKDQISDDLRHASVENIRKAIGSIIWEGYLIEWMLKDILTNVIPKEHIKKLRRLKDRSIEAMTLGNLISVFNELKINKSLVSKAFKWKDDRNDIVHNIQKIMVEHDANQSTPEGRYIFYDYLLGVLNEALEIKIRFSALKLWHDQNILGNLQRPDIENFHGHIEKLFNELLPAAYEEFELAKFGF